MSGGVAEKQVIEVDVVATSQGVDAAIRSAERYGSALDKLDASQVRQAKSSDNANAAAERTARAKANAEAAAARAQRQIDAENRALDAMAQAQQAAAAATGGLTAAQLKAIDAYALATRAGNDNAQAVTRQGEAFKAAAEFILRHPILVLGASVAAARALAGLSTSAAGSLSAASASTAAFAAGAEGMGATVVAGATVAARGLSLASTAATAAAGGFAAYAEKVSGLTTVTGLLSRGLGMIPGFVGPAVAAFALFQGASMAMEKAFADLDRLVQLGERAEKLDLGAVFLKSFEGLAPKIRTSADEMQSALQRASSFVKDQWGQYNNLTKLFQDIDATGAAGASGLRATTQADLASTTEERIRAAIAGMKELDALGLHLASIQVGEKVFGPEFVERLRTGQTTIAQFAADLEAAAEKEVMKQADVDRALALNRQIADTKTAIGDALAVTLDFSAAALAAKEGWLLVLQAVQWVVEKINAANQASSDFVGTTTTSMIEGLKSAGTLATDILAKYGVIAERQKQATKEVYGPQEAYGPPEPKITARQFPYTFGPELPKQQAAAQQAKQSANEAASAYDTLLQKTKDRIEELDLETQYVGKTADAVIKLKLAHDLERAAQKSGIEVTEEMRRSWDTLGTSLATSTTNLAAAKHQLEVTREAQRELGQEFSQFAEDLILGGKSIKEAFAGLANTFARGSLKALLTGEGGLAGLYGTAPTERGGPGGILSGQFNLSSLFQSREVHSAIASGTAEGNASFWDGLFQQRRNAQGVSQGFFSSPLGGTVAAAGAGGAIGYSSQSPLLGAAGGALAGWMATGGNPLGAVAGPAVGIGGMIVKRRPAAEIPQPDTQERPGDGDQRPIAA